MVKLQRFFTHMFYPLTASRLKLSANDLEELTQAVRTSEQRHSGEVRVVIEAALDASDLRAGRTSRERAEELFSELRIWDTEENCGILLYILGADRQFEIVADRGIAAQVSQSEWERISHLIEEKFHSGAFLAGLKLGLQEISALLAQHFPAANHDTSRNELPDKPLVLSL